MTTAAIIKAAVPRDAAKVITRALAPLGCSDRQGKSIVSGRVPGKFRAALVRFLDETITRNKAELDRLQGELRAIAYAEMVARAEERRTAAADQAIAEASGSHYRANDSQPVARGARS